MSTNNITQLETKIQCLKKRLKYQLRRADELQITLEEMEDLEFENKMLRAANENLESQLSTALKYIDKLKQN